MEIIGTSIVKVSWTNFQLNKWFLWVKKTELKTSLVCLTLRRLLISRSVVADSSWPHEHVLPRSPVLHYLPEIFYILNCCFNDPDESAILFFFFCLQIFSIRFFSTVLSERNTEWQCLLNIRIKLSGFTYKIWFSNEQSGLMCSKID